MLFPRYHYTWDYPVDRLTIWTIKGMHQIETGENTSLSNNKRNRVESVNYLGKMEGKQ